MKLHSIKGKNSYCGPAAIAALTGVTTDDAARELRAVSGRRAIKWCYTSELVAALERLGYRATETRVGDNPTLARWLRERENRGVATIVLVTGHFVAVKGNKFADNRNPDPIFISKAPGRRRRVKYVLTVTEG